VADKSTQQLVEALTKAAADPGGMPLYGNKKTPGLFAGSTAARKLAERARNDGYLEVVQSRTIAKKTQEFCVLTDKGLAFLVGHASPREILDRLLLVLQSREAQIDELVRTARHWQQGLESLRTLIRTLSVKVSSNGFTNGTGANGTAHAKPVLPDEIVAAVREWQNAAAADCPLPELCKRLQDKRAGLTIGVFHDALRQLYEERRLYLHPWTGPLYEIPEPAFALLAGHEIAYYASTTGESGL
jgi:hypothetical protein